MVDPAVPTEEVAAPNFSPPSADAYHHLSARGNHPVEVTVQPGKTNLTSAGFCLKSDVRVYSDKAQPAVFPLI